MRAESLLHRLWTISLPLTVGLLVLPGGASAQGDRFGVGVYGGGGAFSDLQRQEIVLEGSGHAGIPEDQVVAAHPTAVVGIRAMWWPRKEWGLRAQFGFASSSMELQRDGTEAFRTTPSAAMEVWSWGAELMLALPIRIRELRPYAVAGAGVASYHLREGRADEPVPLWLFDGRDVRRRAMGTVGLGVEVPLRRRGLALAFELDDQFSRTPVEVRQGEWSEAEGGSWSPQPRVGGVPTATRKVSFVNQVRITVGMSYTTGGGR